MSLNILDEELVEELKREPKDAERIKEIARRIDERSIRIGKPRYKIKTEIFRLLGYISGDSVRTTTYTAVSVLLLSEEYGISEEEFEKLLVKFPQVVDSREESLERKRRYFGLDKKRFGRLLVKHPQVAGYSETKLEEKRQYFGLDRQKFSGLILAHPPIAGLSKENLEEKRRYFGLNKKKFGELIARFPQITSYSKENLEGKKECIGLDRKEFSKLVLKHPQIASLREDNLSRKLYWYLTHADLSYEKILERPQLLSYSFNLRILPRWKYFSKLGGKLDDIEISKFLYLPDEQFIYLLQRKGLNADMADYAQLKRIFEIIDSIDSEKF